MSYFSMQQKLNGRKLLLRFILVFSILFFPSFVVADYSQHPKAADVIQKLVSKHGFERKSVLKILKLAETEPRILKSMKNAAEKTKTWTAYKASFLVQSRIDAGVVFYDKHQKILLAAEERFGVDPLVIVAILGVETNYGTYTVRRTCLMPLPL